IPCADGISEPSRVCVCRMAAAVSKNLPVMIEFLKKNDRQSRCLNQFEWRKHCDEHRIRDTVRQTHAGGPALPKTIRALLIESRSCRLQRNLGALRHQVAQVGSDAFFYHTFKDILRVHHSPYSRQVRFSVPRLRRRRRQVWFPVFRSWNTLCWVTHP